MKTLQYILLAILLGINLVSCETPAISEEVGVEEVNSFDSEEDSGDVEIVEEENKERS
ncbi:hypothetical protein [Aquimarina sp. MMG016]|uniref:hypothetical protein n=1 Tax=Aquimarina sp. MMG016 TaxID=2822690 RepID=UPI001B3A0E1E|nr:hypothetical protein [Aquimarina sp. MMG016]MBQ4820734.1 hypothetical protein [Aquimarina sp. MMG016]